jgi:hypothetical protein
MSADLSLRQGGEVGILSRCTGSCFAGPSSSQDFHNFPLFQVPAQGTNRRLPIFGNSPRAKHLTKHSNGPSPKCIDFLR